MAYVATSPPRCLSTNIANRGLTFWTYENTDPTTTVDNIGYITNAKKLGMKVGDILWYSKTDDAPISQFMMIVSAINATTGAADLSTATVVTAANPD